MKKLSNPEGKVATVKAFQRTVSVYIMPIFATASIEEAAPLADKSIELIILKNKKYFKNNIFIFIQSRRLICVNPVFLK